MAKYFQRVTSLFFLVFATTAFSNVAALKAAEPVKVRLAHWGHEKVFIYFPLYVAIEKGFFREEGIEVGLVYSGNDDQVFAAVIAGQADFGVGDPVFTAVSHEKGGPGKVIATLVGRVSNWGIGKKGLQPAVKDLHQLDGLRVSSFPSPSTAYTILGDIKTGIGLAKMEIVEMAPGTEVAALERGNVDVALAGEPAVSLAESKGYPVVLSLADYYGPFTFSGITTTEETIRQKPEVVQAMISAVQRAIEYVRADPEGGVRVAAKSFPSIDPKVIHQAVQRMVREKSIPDDVRVMEAAWRRTLEMRRLMGDLKVVDLKSSVDNTFAEKAVDAGLREQLRQERLRPQEVPARPISQGRDLFWLWLARVADLVSIILFIGAIVASALILLEKRKHRILTEDERHVGQALFEQFQSKDFKPIHVDDLRRTIASSLSHGMDARTLNFIFDRFRDHYLVLSKSSEGPMARLRKSVITGRYCLEVLLLGR